MLDGHNPNVELALKSADDEFYRSQQFLEKHRGVVDELVAGPGGLIAIRPRIGPSLAP